MRVHVCGAHSLSPCSEHAHHRVCNYMPLLDPASSCWLAPHNVTSVPQRTVGLFSTCMFVVVPLSHVVVGWGGHIRAVWVAGLRETDRALCAHTRLVHWCPSTAPGSTAETSPKFLFILSIISFPVGHMGAFFLCHCALC